MPRLSYLPNLLERLYDFFVPALISPALTPSEGWFSYDGVPLKWQYPVGLLFDLLADTISVRRTGTLPATPGLATQEDASSNTKLPWELVLHFSDWPEQQLIPMESLEKSHQDVFFQSIKEAGYLRNGTAKVILSLSKDDSTSLWQSVQDHDLWRFAPIYKRMLHPPSGEPLRCVPIKVYIPQIAAGQAGSSAGQDQSETRGALRVVQGLVPPTSVSSGGAQTLVLALHSLLPKLFPSRTLYIHARAVLHGAIVPPSTKIEALMEGAAFCDGFLHLAIKLLEFDLPS